MSAEKYTKKRALTYIKQFTNSKYNHKVVEALFSVLDIDEKTTDNEIEIALDSIKENMTLSRDLLTEEGMLLLRKGHMLTDTLKERLKNLSSKKGILTSIYVNKT